MTGPDRRCGTCGLWKRLAIESPESWGSCQWIPDTSKWPWWARFKDFGSIGPESGVNCPAWEERPPEASRPPLSSSNPKGAATKRKCPPDWRPTCSCSGSALEPDENCHIHGHPATNVCPYCGRFKARREPCRVCGYSGGPR
jgi:hypothetical protein